MYFQNGRKPLFRRRVASSNLSCARTASGHEPQGQAQSHGCFIGIATAQGIFRMPQVIQRATLPWCFAVCWANCSCIDVCIGLGTFCRQAGCMYTQANKSYNKCELIIATEQRCGFLARLSELVNNNVVDVGRPWASRDYQHLHHVEVCGMASLQLHTSAHGQGGVRTEPMARLRFVDLLSGLPIPEPLARCPGGQSRPPHQQDIGSAPNASRSGGLQ